MPKTGAFLKKVAFGKFGLTKIHMTKCRKDMQNCDIGKIVLIKSCMANVAKHHVILQKVAIGNFELQRFA